MESNLNLNFNVYCRTFITQSQPFYRLKSASFVCCRGVWNVPFISSIYLVQKQALSKLNGAYGPDSLDPDMAMCKNLREQVSAIVPTESFRHVSLPSAPYNRTKKKTTLLIFGWTFVAEGFEILNSHKSYWFKNITNLSVLRTATKEWWWGHNFVSDFSLLSGCRESSFTPQICTFLDVFWKQTTTRQTCFTMICGKYLTTKW